MPLAVLGGYNWPAQGEAVNQSANQVAAFAIVGLVGFVLLIIFRRRVKIGSTYYVLGVLGVYLATLLIASRFTDPMTACLAAIIAGFLVASFTRPRHGRHRHHVSRRHRRRAAVVQLKRRQAGPEQKLEQPELRAEQNYVEMPPEQKKEEQKRYTPERLVPGGSSSSVIVWRRKYRKYYQHHRRKGRGTVEIPPDLAAKKNGTTGLNNINQAPPPPPAGPYTA